VLALAALAGAPLTLAVVTAPPAAAAVQVSTPSDLFSAWQTATSIQVVNDITFQQADCTTLGGGPERNATNGDVVLDGQGHTLTMNCVGFSNGPSMLRATAGDSVTLQNVTITGGTVGSNSGGVCKEGSGNLTLNAVTMTGNNNDGGGAVCYSGGGALTIKNSTLTNNSSCSNGGAIEVSSSSNAVITNTTIANNVTDSDGGAIAHDGNGNVSVTNSTITGNAANSVGGLEVDNGNLTLVYVTDVNNTTEAAPTVCASAASKGVTSDTTPDSTPEPSDKHPALRAQAAGDTPANLRVDQPANSLTTFGSVIAQPNGGPNCGDFAGPPPGVLANTISNGWNFADDASCGLTGTGDRQVAGSNPQLGALASNGGPTQTLLPQTGSPLIDGVPLASCQADGAAGIAIDQRFLIRPSGAGCDIGAVEVQVAAALVIQPKFTG
jgi:hypothetical protein